MFAFKGHKGASLYWVVATRFCFFENDIGFEVSSRGFDRVSMKVF